MGSIKNCLKDNAMTEIYIIEQEPVKNTLFLAQAMRCEKSGRIMPLLCVVYSFWPKTNELTRDVYDNILQDDTFCYGRFHDSESAMKKAHEFAIAFYDTFYKNTNTTLEDRLEAAQH
ncbi:MAG: hypothetical protein RL557_940 [archaeon]